MVNVGSIGVLCLVLSSVCTVEVSLYELDTKWNRSGDIYPIDPYTIVGEPVSMYCSVKRKVLKQYKVSIRKVLFKVTLATRDFYFVEDVQRINKTVAQAVFTNITTSLNDACITCLLKINNTHELNIDSTYFYVGYLPAVGSIDTVVTQDLKNVHVNFTRSHKNPTYIVNFMVAVRRGDSANSVYHNCSHPIGQMLRTSDTCLFNLTDLLSEVYYTNVELWFKVYSWSPVGRAVGEERSFKLHEQLKPLAVQDARVEYNGGRNSVVRWFYPQPIAAGLQFTVTYSTGREPPKTLEVKIGDKYDGPIHVNLTQLSWASEYQVSIIGQPYYRGYLSNPVTLTFKTDESVPDENPIIASSGYERRFIDGRQHLIVYWKPAQQTNGEITQMRVKVMVSQVMTTQVIDQSAFSRGFTVISNTDVDAMYYILVLAGTRVGYNNNLQQEAMIMVPKLSEALSTDVLENITAIVSEKEDLTVSWKRTPHAADYNVTVYWCKGQQGFDCQGEFDFITVLAPTNSYTIRNLSGVFSFKFGVSVESLHATSGITWINCTHDSSQDAQPPSMKSDPTVSKDSITLYLSQPPCSGAETRGYIYAYNVTYCPGKHDSGCPGKVKLMMFWNTTDQYFTIPDLKPNTDYHIAVRSLTLAGLSASVLSVPATTARTMIWIPIVTPFLGLLVLATIAYFIRRIYKKQTKKIPIEIPTTNEYTIPDLSRPAPYGGYAVANTYTTMDSTGLGNQSLPELRKTPSGDEDKHKMLGRSLISLPDETLILDQSQPKGASREKLASTEGRNHRPEQVPLLGKMENNGTDTVRCSPNGQSEETTTFIQPTKSSQPPQPLQPPQPQLILLPVFINTSQGSVNTDTESTHSAHAGSEEPQAAGYLPGEERTRAIQIIPEGSPPRDHRAYMMKKRKQNEQQQHSPNGLGSYSPGGSTGIDNQGAPPNKHSSLASTPDPARPEQKAVSSETHAEPILYTEYNQSLGSEEDYDPYQKIYMDQSGSSQDSDDRKLYTKSSSLKLGAITQEKNDDNKLNKVVLGEDDGQSSGDNSLPDIVLPALEIPAVISEPSRQSSQDSDEVPVDLSPIQMPNVDLPPLQMPNVPLPALQMPKINHRDSATLTKVAAVDPDPYRPGVIIPINDRKTCDPNPSVKLNRKDGSSKATSSSDPYMSGVTVDIETETKKTKSPSPTGFTPCIMMDKDSVEQSQSDSRRPILLATETDSGSSGNLNFSPKLSLENPCLGRDLDSDDQGVSYTEEEMSSDEAEQIPQRNFVDPYASGFVITKP